MNNKRLHFSFILLLLSASSFANVKSNDEGKNIFSSRCASCHNINIKVVGPALAGINERHNIDWIIKFVHSSQSLVKSNDKSAVELFNQFKIVMPDHPDLSADQIKSIIEYVKTESSKKASENVRVVKPSQLQPNYLPISITNFGFFGSYVALVIVLVAIMVLAVKVKELERNKVSGDDVK
ncbi:MAG: hypothetical protein C5B59_14160 [Bacteroidetes bacterium]|nr:MAG: hypothetical protein C5B59_14160 [Bacteroidota bacterium]